MWWATGFFGYFTVLLVGGVLNSPDQYGLSYPLFRTTVGIVGSGAGGYVLWLIFLAVQVYTMYRSARGKLDARDTVEDADDARGLLA